MMIGTEAVPGEQKFKDEKKSVHWLKSNTVINDPVASSKGKSDVLQHTVAKLSLKLFPIPR